MRIPSLRRPAPLLDPNSLESGPNASEVATPGAPIKLGQARAEEVARLVRSRFDLSQEARSQYEGQWALALAYYNGRAWLDWDPELGLSDVRDKDDLRWYRSSPLIKPLCKLAVARITSNRPDVQVLPRSKDRELDATAAEELRLVIEHYNTKNHFRLLLQRIATYAWMATTGFLLQYWDPNALAEIPVEWDTQKAPIRYESRRVGNYVEEVVPGHEVYADPRATCWNDCGWIVRVQRMTNEDIEHKWGRVPSGSDRSTKFTDLFDSFVTPWNKGVKGALRQQQVATCYESPSPRYPEGRVMVVCGSEVLEYREALPCGFVPLLPLGCTQGVGTPYHSGVGGDLIGPQYDYNLLRSRLLGGLRDQKPTVVRQIGDLAGADIEEVLLAESGGVSESPRLRTIWHKLGVNAPQVYLPQLVDVNALQSVMVDLRTEMAEIAGVHRVSSGAGDPNATSGISIRLLKDSDESSGAEFSHEVEVFLEERARRIGMLVAKYVAEKRAWELDDRNNSETREVVYSGLEALRQGGLAAVRVVEGSATPRTPEAEDAQVMEMAASGLFGDPAAPETQDLVLSLLNSPLAMRAAEAKRKAKEEALERQVLEGEIQAELEAQEAEQAGMNPTQAGLPLDEVGVPAAPSVMAPAPAPAPSLNEFLGSGG